MGIRITCAVLAVTALTAGQARAAVLVVDRDKAQCPQAGYTSIQQAVDAAQQGDKVQVCPDHYAEQVTVDKPLRLQGDPDAIEAIDCFAATASQLGDLDPSRQAIIGPPGGGFSVGFRLAANDIRLRGLVIEGASVGVDASDNFSGYRIDHNLIRLSSLFGVDFGSQGARSSRVDHNCLRDNASAIVSELDDDSLWKPSDGPERDSWNARDLLNARIDHNATSDNGGLLTGSALQITGPGRRVGVRIDDNISSRDRSAIILSDSTDSAIVGNDVIDTPVNLPFGFHAMVIGGGNDNLVIAGNRVLNPGGNGIEFTEAPILGDVLPEPNRGVVVTQNQVTGGAIGMDVRPNNLADSLISENTFNDTRSNGVLLQANTGNEIRDNQADNNFVSGIQIVAGSTGNVIRDNRTDNNGVSGISATLGATRNQFEHNSMHGNGWRTDTTLPRGDARDLNPLLNSALQNTWAHNDCDTDIPAGLICGG